MRRAEAERDLLRAELEEQGVLWRDHHAALQADHDLLRAKLTAHHAIHNLPEHLVRDWAISHDHTCPVCKEVEDARTTGEPGRSPG